MVAPVCVKDADFRFGRVAAFLGKIVLQEFYVGVVHRQAHLLQVGLKFRLLEFDEAVNNGNVAGLFCFHF